MRLAIATLALALTGCGPGLPAAAPSASPPAPRGTIAIGVEAPLTGAEAVEGTPVLDGVRFAVGRQPVVGGFALTVRAFDNSVAGVHNAQRGRQNLELLAADQHVLGVIGPFNASVAVAAIPVSAAAHLPLVSPATSNPCLTRDLPFCAGLATRLRQGQPVSFFRVAGTDDLQGPVMARYARERLKLESVAVSSDGEIHGRLLADGFQAEFERLGGRVPVRTNFDPNLVPDFTGFLSQARQGGAQGVYFGGTVASRGCQLRAQMKEFFPVSTPELGGEGIALDRECLRLAGSNASNLQGTVVSVNADALPAARPVVAAFKKEFPNRQDYNVYTIPAYDAARALIAAIERAIEAAGGGLPSREQVRAQLAATRDFPGTTGRFSFDVNGDTTLRYVSVYETRGAPVDWVFVTQYAV
ncbi:MAG TPA: branched-chain amino acid ABC transporter substrate-binding protein [Candidatus Acidoferrales bacterium]|nr:branched-chain amino acid ABC transporter substrate-binding protein [Candidatus Acidoferrales bacterium]